MTLQTKPYPLTPKTYKLLTIAVPEKTCRIQELRIRPKFVPQGSLLYYSYTI